MTRSLMLQHEVGETTPHFGLVSRPSMKPTHFSDSGPTDTALVAIGRSAGGTPIVVNRLPVPIVAFVRDISPSAMIPALIVRAEGAATATLPGWRGEGEFVIDHFEPVARNIPIHPSAVLRSGEREIARRAAAVAALWESVALEGSDRESETGRTRLAQLAQFELEAERDEVFGHLRMQSWNTAVEGALVTVSEAARSFLAGGGSRADMLLASLDETRRAVEREVMAHAAFHSALAAALDGFVPTRSSATQSVSAVRELKRASAFAPSISDTIELTAEVASDVATMIGELAFDNGARHVVVLRLVAGTSRWIGRVFWPVDAALATMRVRVPGGQVWTDCGQALHAGREPLATLQHRVERKSGRLTPARGTQG